MTDFPSVGEFRRALLTESLDEVVRGYIFEGVPYVFRETPGLMEVLRNHLCNDLGISAESTIIICSAKIGFSLSPDTVFRQFSDESDIDVLVVDERIFDDIWKIVLMALSAPDPRTGRNGWVLGQTAKEGSLLGLVCTGQNKI